MLQPELGGDLRLPEPIPDPSWRGRALGGFFLVVALICAGFSVYNAAHTAGLAGKHGTLTVDRCWTDRSSSRSRVEPRICGGTFRAEGGGKADTSATVKADSKPGARIEVQKTANLYLPTGFGETWRWNALFFVGWIVAGLGVPFLATGIMPRGSAQAVEVGRMIGGTRANRVMKYLCLGGLAGTAVSLYLTWLF